MVKKQILKKLCRFRDLLEKDGIPVDKLLLFGSHARGTARDDSDIDVCVISRKFTGSRFEARLLLFHKAPKIDPRIEPVAFSLEDYRKNRISPLLHQIRKEGIEI